MSLPRCRPDSLGRCGYGHHHHYVPRGTAAEIWHRRDSEIIISGPAGTGKSRACLEKVHAAMIKYPGAKALLLRQTAVSLAATGLQTYQKFVADAHIRTGEVEYYGGSQTEPPQYRYSNGSSIMFGGMDKPTKIMSSEYDLIYVQEVTELAEEAYEFGTTRLRNGVMPYQQMLSDANPNVPWHWVKQRAENGIAVMLDSAHTENPMLFDAIRITGRDGSKIEYRVTATGDAYIAKLMALTGVRRQRLFQGLWVAADGMVYERYDPRVHLIERFEIPREWRRWWVVDFGHTNPFVLQCWAEDPDGRLYMYREIYMTKRTVDEHARQILDIVSTPDPRDPDSRRKRVWHEPKPWAVVCDHDAEGRDTLAQALNLGTVPAVKGRADGIEAMQRRIKIADDGKPRMYFLKDSLVEKDHSLADAKKPWCTPQEILGYVWAPVPGIQNKQEGRLKEEPMDRDNHGMDCSRYISAELELGSPGIRSM